MPKFGAGHSANKKDPKGKGAFPAKPKRGSAETSQSAVGTSRKALPPWMKKK